MFSSRLPRLHSHGKRKIADFPVVRQCTTLPSLLVTLNKSGKYRLQHTPHFCHRWYHGGITREVRAARSHSFK